MGIGDGGNLVGKVSPAEITVVGNAGRWTSMVGGIGSSYPSWCVEQPVGG